MDFSSMVIVPCVGLISPAMQFNSVVFPQPLGPMMVSNSPFDTEKEIFSKIVVGGPAVSGREKDFIKLLTSTTTSDTCTAPFGEPTEFADVVSSDDESFSIVLKARSPS
ncbi:MAG: hypothetical protein WA614_04015 [Acidimicrobiales bacterium]